MTTFKGSLFDSEIGFLPKRHFVKCEFYQNLHLKRKNTKGIKKLSHVAL